MADSPSIPSGKSKSPKRSIADAGGAGASANRKKPEAPEAPEGMSSTIGSILTEGRANGGSTSNELDLI